MRFQYAVYIICGLLSACSTNLSVDGDAQISCSAENAAQQQCPKDWKCDTVRKRCAPRIVNIAPRVTLEIADTAPFRALSEVSLVATISDADTEDVELKLFYSLDGENWNDASVLEDLRNKVAPVEPITIPLTWLAINNASVDTGAVLSSTDLTYASTDTQEGTATEFIVTRETMFFKLQARNSRDTDSSEVGSATAGPVTVGNQPATVDTVIPSLIVPSLTGESYAGGVVPIKLALWDADLDLVGIEVEFQLPNEPRLWRQAQIIVGRTSDLVTGDSANTAVEYVILWDSLADTAPINNVPQGVGNERVPGVLIRVRAIDEPQQDVRFPGEWKRSAPFLVNNQTPPFVSNLSALNARTKSVSGALAIQYTLSDLQADPTDIRVQYRLSTETTWRPCSEYPTFRSEGRYNLESAPIGIPHIFVWDAANDIGQKTQYVELKITPADGRAGIGYGSAISLDALLGVELNAEKGRDLSMIQTIYAPALGVQVSDFDGDFLPDVLSYGDDSDLTELNQFRINLARISASGMLDDSALYSAQAPIRSVAAIHLGSSQRADVLVLTDALSLELWKTDEAGALTFESTTLINDASEVYGLVVADIDGDGDDDIVISTKDTTQWALHILTQDQSKLLLGAAVAVDFGPGQLLSADLSHDNTADIIYANSTVSEPQLTVFMSSPQADGPLSSALTIDLDTLYNQESLDSQIIDMAAGSGALDAEVLYIAMALDAGSRGKILGLEFSEIISSEPALVFRRDLKVSPDAVASSEGSLYAVLSRPSLDTFSVMLGFRRTQTEGNSADWLEFLAAHAAVSQSTLKGFAMADFDANGVDEFLLPTPLDTLIVRGMKSQFDPLLVNTTNQDYGFMASARIAGPTRRLDSRTNMFGADLRADLSQSFFSVDELSGTLHSTIPESRYGFSSGIASPGVQLKPFSSNAVNWKNTYGHTGDIDGDGIVDIIFSSNRGATVARSAVYFGGTLTDSGFATPQTLDHIVLAVGDFDGDAKAEIMAYDNSSIVMYNFAADLSYSITDLTLPSYIRSLAVGDVNADGRLDVIAELAVGRAFDVLINNGSGFTAVNQPAQLEPVAAKVSNARLADFNHDGVLDLAFMDNSLGITITFGGKNNGRPTGSFEGRVVLSLANAPSNSIAGFEIGDFNEDGCIDIVASGTQSIDGENVSGLYMSAGECVGGHANGNFQDLVFVSNGKLVPQPPMIADINSDFVTDLVLAETKENGRLGNVVFYQGQRLSSRRTWSQELSFSPGTASTTLQGLGDLSTALDAFSQPLSFRLGRRLYSSDPMAHIDQPELGDANRTNDFLHLARLAGVPDTQSPNLTPLTSAWHQFGDTRVRPLIDSKGNRRITIESRFVGSSSTATQEGLFMDSGRYIIIDMPVYANRNDLFSETSGQYTKVLIARYTGWRRANTDPTDPLNTGEATTVAANVLPLGGLGAETKFQPEYEWESIAEDEDGDLSTGTGRRFILTEDFKIKIITDRLGVFQAFFSYP